MEFRRHVFALTLAHCLIVFLTITAHAQAVFVVNATADTPDNNPGNGTCRTAAGVCTLRAAIEEANATPNGATPDVIVFTTIPVVSGRATISIVGNALPTITEAVVIDGTTAAGEVVIDGTNTTAPGSPTLSSGLILGEGSNGSKIRGLSIGNFPWYGILVTSEDNTITDNRIGVREDRTDIGNDKAGIYLSNDHNTVGKIGQGNVIGFNGSAGIHLLHAEYNTIRGNYIGTDDTGFAMGNYVLNSFEFAGGITVHADNNIIGGPQPGMGNTIGFNSKSGIYVNGTGNKIRGNHIGADSTGRSIANAFRGILIHFGGGNTIGGGEPGMGNVIGFNDYGILIWGPETKIQGNFIGTNAAGNDLGNGTAIAISTEEGFGTIIGYTKSAQIATPAGKANIIAYNTSGVLIADEISGLSPTGSTVRGNSFFANDDLAIDLGSDGATANDAGDADAGGNTRLNFPELSRAFYRPGSDAIVLEFSVSSDDAIVPYPLTVDAYLADDAVSGEGKTYIGSYSYITSGANVQWEIPAAGIAWDPLDYVVLTATDTLGNTSEFSPALGPLDPLAVVGAQGGLVDTADLGDRMEGDELGAAYPNPFNPWTAFTLSLAEASPAYVAVYDALGRQVALLHDGELSASTHSFTFDGAGLATGVYLLRVQTSRFVQSRRLMLVK